MMASQLYLLNMRLGLILTGILLASTLTLTEQLSQHKVHHNHLSARTLKGDREPNLHNAGKESTTAKQYDSNQKRSTFITTLLHDYAEDVPPNFDQGEAIEVRCAMHINTFDSINESSMDYELNIFMREYWTDHRLAYNTSIPDESITLDPRMIDRIWVPDTFFHNEKKGSFHDITVPNRLLRIRQDGSIEYSIRLSLTLSCPMVLNKFPMDSQICYAQIESYAYTTDKILLRWAERDAVEIVPNLELPQFQLTRLSYGECYRNYSTGSFPCLQINFFLVRDVGFYLIQVYVPSMLIVILSWVSFWINVDAIPARISLGVLTVLTMTTHGSGLRSTLPKVSYVKAIDVWMSTCLLFVFAALLEFAVVNVLSRKEIRRLVTLKRQKIPNSKLGFRSKECYRESTGNGHSSVLEERVLWDEEGRQRGRDIDKLSRKIFPTLFIIFTGFYWVIYQLSQEAHDIPKYVRSKQHSTQQEYVKRR